jgi:hypothetical protein
MKSGKYLFLTITMIFLIIKESLQKLRGRQPSTVTSPVVTTTSSVVPPPPKPKLGKPDVGDIWNDLFTVSRTTACKAEQNRLAILAEIKNESEMRDSTMTVNDSAFGWIRKWGFGPISYLMDFFDGSFRDDVLEEFKSIHNVTMHEDPENTPEYSDVFDFAGRIANAPEEKQDALMRDLKKFEKTYDPIVYQLSANAVQIHKSMKNFNWFIDPGMADFAADFVSRYDINHDGRLNPKELVLGSIMFNKAILGSKKCNHCFTHIARKIGALFTYLDCGETGFINADQMWKALPDMRRNSSQYNIFGYGNSENIRTNAINDFILKNEKAKDAYVSKEEFISGILLGIWDRQVSENAIIDDDARNLKKLRWSDNNMVDTAAYNYVKAVTKQRLLDEEKERFEKWERERLKKEQRAKELWNQQMGNM